MMSELFEAERTDCQIEGFFSEQKLFQKIA